jgi:hypothetical protein
MSLGDSPHEGVNISGIIESVGGDIVGGNKVLVEQGRTDDQQGRFDEPS